MGSKTNIEWCDKTFNPWLGCTKISPACDHCYAENLMDHRMKTVKWGAGEPRVRTSAANWKLPLKWNKQAEQEGKRFRVFCASLADVFDNEVPEEWRISIPKSKQLNSTNHGIAIYLGLKTTLMQELALLLICNTSNAMKHWLARAL